MHVDAQLLLQDLQIGYPAAGGFKRVVDGLSLQLGRGEIGCLLGASGCGKTTVLRTIAGFEPLQQGRIVLAGRELATPQQALPAEQRRVGLMFQDYALFPHLDVAANVAFGLRGLPRAQRKARVQALLQYVGLPGLEQRYPHELSGGQQQRVALARALAPAPDLLLLDEPFSNLDVDTRQRLAGELRELLKAAGTTVLMVTHDQSEAFAMADRIGVMHDGRLLQWDTAQALYQAPLDPFVAGFIGRGTVVDAAQLGMGEGGRVLVRPQSLQLDPQAALRARVEAVVFRGPGSSGWVRLAGGERLELDFAPDQLPEIGAEVGLGWHDPAPVRFAD
ncbi:ABC transporter ATP-binding protein [Stenotrophomonas pigmentata]|uniref:ABC transporter ATP-binding protein n=1 Tax=Stenotrophomonas pigmentata TaxID=3055080 RepID=UPI0026EBE2FA|nr:ABC transporter ATP-binding protein [Stenotrophomonas sp. 610A2]